MHFPSSHHRTTHHVYLPSWLSAETGLARRPGQTACWMHLGRPTCVVKLHQDMLLREGAYVCSGALMLRMGKIFWARADVWRLFCKVTTKKGRQKIEGQLLYSSGRGAHLGLRRHWCYSIDNNKIGLNAQGLFYILLVSVYKSRHSAVYSLLCVVNVQCSGGASALWETSAKQSSQEQLLPLRASAVRYSRSTNWDRTYRLRRFRGIRMCTYTLLRI